MNDLIDIQTCRENTKAMNEYTNDDINKRKLQFKEDKTHTECMLEKKRFVKVYTLKVGIE